MSFAVSHATQLFITKRKSQLEKQLMDLAHQRQYIAAASANDSSDLLTSFQRSLAAQYGETDESAVLTDVISSTEYTSKYNTMTAQYQAKEKLLDIQQKLIETELQALNTQSESVDKLVDKGIEKSFGYAK